MAHEEKTKRVRLLVDECLKAQRFGEAVPFYRQLIDLNPDDDSYRLGLAWAYHDSGKTEQAVACFEQVFERELQRRIFTGFAFDELVRIYKGSKDHERLVDLCERAAAAQPGDIALMGELGEAYLKAGRPADALRIFESMTEMEPDDSSFWCSLGRARIMNDDSEGGLEACRRAAAIDPADAGSFFSRMARFFLQAGQVENAERAFREGLSKHGEDPLLRLGLGDVLIQQGKVGEGVAAYQGIIDRNRADSGVYLNRLGHTLSRARFHREAVAAFQQAIACDPENPFYYRALSESYLSLGNEEAASQALRQAGGK